MALIVKGCLGIFVIKMPPAAIENSRSLKRCVLNNALMLLHYLLLKWLSLVLATVQRLCQALVGS